MTTVTSKVTSKNQVTVPAEVRRALGLRDDGILAWEVEAGQVRVRLLNPPLYHHQGAVSIGPGSVVEDVQEARRRRTRGR